MKITSVNNELVKEVAKLQQRKYRDESGLFLLEGAKSIEEAIAYGVKVKYIFIEEGYERFNEFNPIITNTAVLSKISTTVSSPKCIAVGNQLNYIWDKNYKRVVLLENIKDAGNLGTILRTSSAFGVDAVILYGDTVDLYNPKCVRASVGNLWKVPVFQISDINELKIMTNNLRPVATLPKNDKSIWLNDFKDKNNLLIMFGTESTGLSSELINYAENNGYLLTIEMCSNVESLNLSISTGVILYKIFTS